MPIRQSKDVKQPKTNIGAAFDVDYEEVEGGVQGDQLDGPNSASQSLKAVSERKKAIIQVATYPSWRQHFHIEAAKRGEKLAPIALQALIDRYGLPEK